MRRDGVHETGDNAGKGMKTIRKGTERVGV